MGIKNIMLNKNNKKGGVAKLLKSREAALSFYKYKGKQTLKISC
jgi:hypothetical protein